ncbi:cytochrome c biogenesis protein ResB [Haloferula sargassicola]|uniref:ResB-like domain-containing protein n=1 Tax=Haloferula sargassicola TaxID=490096 RepID=A0ABP9UT36_9BACT
MKRTSFPVSLWKFLSGYGLATTLLVLLGVETWLATLEMVDAGLLATLRKYFHWSSWYLIPEIHGKSLLVPLPGGYWVCALLLVNMICGGLIRARKGWKTAGVLLAHFSIVFMVAAGGVAQLFEKRGVMFLIEGEQADYAVSLNKPSVEVIEFDDGKPTGEVAVANEPDLRGLKPDHTRVLDFQTLPFNLEITGWQANGVVRKEGDQWMLRPMPLETEGEMNAPACVARVVNKDGTTGEAFILAVPPVSTGQESYPPRKVEVDGRTFGIRLVKETIPVPYTVKLDDAVAEYYPNSMRPKSFSSSIERIGDSTVPVEISMNEPMRYGGFTFFQRTMSGAAQMNQGPEFSGFEVVSNPADKWPEYSLYLVTAGLLIHFITKLVIFIAGGAGRRQPQEA